MVLSITGDSGVTPGSLWAVIFVIQIFAFANWSDGPWPGLRRRLHYRRYRVCQRPSARRSGSVKKHPSDGQVISVAPPMGLQKRTSILSTPNEPTWRPMAAGLAWLAPGLGHWWIGDKARAVVLAVSISALWLGGLLIGGFGAVDSKQNQWWFVGQMLTAPSVAVEGMQRTGVIRAKKGPDDRGLLTYEPPFGRSAEQGVLYTALAGLLNLLTMIDVLYRDPPPARALALKPGVAR